MKSTLPPQIGGNRTRMLQQRVRSVTQVRAHGTQRIPAPTRGVIVQQGDGGALVTWHLPKRYGDVTGYRIYIGTEKNLAMQIRDRGARQMFIPLTSGSSAPLNNIFLSAVNGFREGPKIQLQTSAVDNAALLGTKPVPTDDFQNVFSGGLDKTQSGQPSGKRVP